MLDCAGDALPLRDADVDGGGVDDAGTEEPKTGDALGADPAGGGAERLGGAPELGDPVKA